MDQFFVKKGQVTSAVSKEVKVSYKKIPTGEKNKDLLKQYKEAQRKRQEEEQEKKKESKRQSRAYEFREELKTDEEKLNDFMMPEKKLKVDEKTKENDKLTVQERDLLDTQSTIYSKGFKMLFAGSGGKATTRMGKNEDGRLEPIAPEKVKSLGTKKNIAKKTFGQKNSKGKFADPIKNDLTLNEESVLQAIHSWRRGVEKRKRRSSVDNIEVEVADAMVNEDHTYKIIDMRGSAPKTVGSLNELRQSFRDDVQKKEVYKKRQYDPSLLFNKLKVRHQVLHQQLKAEKIHVLKTQNNVEEYKKSFAECKKSELEVSERKEQLSKFLEMVKNLQNIEKNPKNLESILSIFSELLDASSSDFEKYGLRNYLINIYIKISSVSNRGEGSLFTEKNTKNLRYFCILLKLSYELCTEIENFDDELEMIASYEKDLEQTLSRTWKPPFANFIQNSWDHEDPGDLVKYFEKIREFFPKKMFSNYFDTIIVPVLISRLKRWDLKTSSLYPHLWIHPWYLFCSEGKKIQKK